MLKNIARHGMAVTALVFSSAVFAGLVSYKDDNSIILIEGGSGNLTLPKFDTSLGNLMSVELNFSVIGTASNQALAIPCVDGVCPGEIALSPYEVVAEMGLSLGDISLVAKATGSSKIYRCSPNGDGTADCFGSVSASDTDTANSSSLATLSAFSGIDTFTIPYSLESDDLLATGSFSAEIVYTFDERPSAVPEPASLALLGIGLAGLGFARRRKAVVGDA